MLEREIQRQSTTEYPHTDFGDGLVQAFLALGVISDAQQMEYSSKLNKAARDRHQVLRQRRAGSV